VWAASPAPAYRCASPADFGNCGPDRNPIVAKRAVEMTGTAAQVVLKPGDDRRASRFL